MKVDHDICMICNYTSENLHVDFLLSRNRLYKFLERSFGEEEGFAVDRKSIDDMFNNYSPLFNNIHFASRQLFVN